MWVARTAVMSRRSFTSNAMKLPNLVRQAKKSTDSFSVVQLNILASNLAKPDRFPYVEPEILDWEVRKNILMRQFDELQADIYCLEECSDYWTFFRPSFLALGYESVYVKRPSAHTSTWSGEKKMDGCGIFFRMTKFQLKECDSVNFRDEHDRVALLTLLQETLSGRLILVASTHLWWNSRKIDHQMKQLIELDKEVAQLTENIRQKYSHLLQDSTVPVVLCGDFNNSPSSPLYEYMENSFLKNASTMKSAYTNYKMIDGTSVEGESNEPPHTTVNYRRCWTIDFIWYSTEHMVVEELLEIPSEEELRSEQGPPGWEKLADTPLDSNTNANGIPNSRHGSDHIPIMATFRFR